MTNPTPRAPFALSIVARLPVPMLSIGLLVPRRIVTHMSPTTAAIGTP
jgi:hypothetical protein